VAFGDDVLPNAGAGFDVEDVPQVEVEDPGGSTVAYSW
jgi:hypothetical protein